MRKVDIVLVGYRSDMYLPRLRQDISNMSACKTAVHYFDNSRNSKTLSRLWNDLAAAGRGDYIVIMNPDIALCPDWDLRLVEAIDRNPDLAFATPDPFGSSPTSEPMPSRQAMREISDERQIDDRLTTDQLQFYVAAIRRDYWNKLRGVDERMRFYMSDSDAIHRALHSFCLRSVRVHSCPIWHRGSASTAEAIEKKELDQKVEYDTAFGVWREVREGRWKQWHDMTDQERADVRKHPVYSKMGVQ
jgi:hypothetical protein